MWDDVSIPLNLMMTFSQWEFCGCLHYNAADDSDNDDDEYDIDYNIIDDYDEDQNYSHCDFICI